MNPSESSRPGVVFFLCVVATLAGGCDRAQKTSDKDITTVDRARVVEMLANEKEPAVLIDVRQPGAFREGTLPGAINIPIQQLRPGDRRLGEATHLIVFSSGRVDDLLSSAAAKTLLRHGYVNVYDFRGGLKSWEQEGGEVVRPQADSVPTP